MFSNQNAYASDHVLQIISLSEIATSIYSSDDMIIQAANESMIKLWGKGSDVIGKSVNEVMPELVDQPFFEIYRNVLHTGKTYQAVNMPTTLVIDGKAALFYFDFMYKAVKNDSGEIYCVLNTATDVTERYNAEMAIRASEAREQALNEKLAASNEELEATIEELTCANEELLQSAEQVVELNESLSESKDQLDFAINAGNLGTWDLNPRTMKFTCNGRLKEWFGLHATDEINLELATSAIVEKDRARVSKAINDALDYRNGGKYAIQYSVLSPNESEPRILRTKGQALFNEAGESYRFSGIMEDVTEEYTSNAALAEAQEGFEIALKAAKLGSYELNLKTMQLFSSDQCKENHGLNLNGDFSYEDLIQAIQPSHRSSVEQHLKYAIEHKSIYEVEYPVTWPDGSTHWIRSSGKARYDYLGEPLRMNVVSHDITEQKKDEIRKNDFIGMVSHELKTPLTSFKGYIQILQKNRTSNGDNFSVSILDKVDRQLDKMSKLVNGFLNLSRLESGKIFLQKEVFNLEELLTEIIEEHQILITQHQLILEGCEQAMINADREKIGNVISNLLNNAAKYSPLQSKINVLCNVEDDMVRIQVIDQGEGIPSEDLNRLFERYYRAEHTKHISGFGIGLYLSAEIVERHLGKIGAKSEIGKGSQFWFTLPIHKED